MHPTNPAIDEKASDVARLMTRLMLGSQEDLPLFTMKIWVAQLARQSAELLEAIDALPQIDLFTLSAAISSRLTDEDADWFAVGLETHGKTTPVPDTLKEA